MKFDSLYEQLLNELFNTKPDIDEWVYDDPSWRTFIPGPNDINYILNLTKFWRIKLPYPFFNEDSPVPRDIIKQLEKQGSHSWVVEFGADDGDSMGITGEQGSSSAKVFSLIGNAIIDKIQQDPNSFKNIVFEAKEPSRRSLYGKLSLILAKKFRKTVTSAIVGDGEWFFLMSQ